MANEQKQKRDFSNFKLKVRRAPTTDRAYSRYGYRSNNRVRDFSDLELVERIIREGDAADLREVSRFYIRTSGIYKANILFLTNLLLYKTVVSPIYDTSKKLNKDTLLKTYNRAVKFVEDLNVPVNFAHITYEMLASGIYYGILRNDKEQGVTIQDLPISYCRTRFKNTMNLDIPEFNVQYFETISDTALRNEAIAAYPPIVQQAWRKYTSGKICSPWVEILPELGGACFFYGDKVPMLVASIPELIKLRDAEEREAKRDENELYKLLIQKMPTDSKGELLFQLEEVYDIHDSIAEMLADVDTVDVLTTFGDTSLESLQDSNASSQSSDRIDKYKTAAYDQLGRSALIFNGDGSSTIPYSITKDEALMIGISHLYEAWIQFQINQLYAKSSLRFGFEILPITNFNKEKEQARYLSGAQYGYSKIYAGAALGINQSNMLPLMSFENDYLNLPEKMIPLQSSYTSSGSDTKEKSGAQNKQNSSSNSNISNSGGRPTLSDTEKSEKTMANIESKG